MNREEILNMPAGREMDVLIADFVTHKAKPKDAELIGGEWTTNFDGDDWEFWPPYYSTDVAAAWEVLDLISGRFFMIQILRWDFQGGITIVLQPRKGHDEINPHITVWAETLPLSVCRAVLIATLEAQ
jgi:hypothetical protein